jgi:hypothetical protein
MAASLDSAATGWEIERQAFGLFVHAHRCEALGLSMRAAAEITGISYATHCRAERAQPISAGNMLRLCLWIDANPYWFLVDPMTGRRIADPPPTPVPRETLGETR